jgi:hypothetical protein
LGITQIAFEISPALSSREEVQCARSCNDASSIIEHIARDFIACDRKKPGPFGFWGLGRCLRLVMDFGELRGESG